LEVGVQTKVFPDLSLENSLCNGGYKTKSEKPLFFLAYHAPRNFGIVKRIFVCYIFGLACASISIAII
jgi:hypothetical protein